MFRITDISGVLRKKILLLLWLLAAGAATAEAAPKENFDYDISLGFNLGASTPMGLPAEIRKIDHYRPTVNLSIGGAATYMVTPRWGASAGLTFETKGMSTGISVRNYHLTMNIQEGDDHGTKTGYYTGEIRNKTKITYLTIPLNAVFRPSGRWKVEAGPYFSFAIDRSFIGHVEGGTMHEDTPLMPAIGISKAEYDYSDDIRVFDFGIGAGGRYRVYKGLSVKARLTWGVLSTLDPSRRKIDMDTYNVYLNIGFTYTL